MSSYLRYRADPTLRFWEKVDRAGGDGACWPWLASTRHGYGQYGVAKGHIAQAHRYAYELAVGPIPAGLEIDHLCRNTRCVNPNHLEAVTGRVNSLRSMSLMAINARKTHCKRGHALDGANLYRYGQARQCRTCRRLRDRAHRGVAA